MIRIDEAPTVPQLHAIFADLAERHRHEFARAGLGAGVAKVMFTEWLEKGAPAWCILVDGQPAMLVGIAPGSPYTFAAGTEAYWRAGPSGVLTMRRVVRMAHERCGAFLTTTPSPDDLWRRWATTIGLRHLAGDVYGYGV